MVCLLLQANAPVAFPQCRILRLLGGADETQLLQGLVPVRLMLAIRPALGFPYPVRPEASRFDLFVGHIRSSLERPGFPVGQFRS